MREKPDLPLDAIREIMSQEPDDTKSVGEEPECEHQYRETSAAAPLGVVCIKCGHFVGAWE